jgi:ribokinase
MLGGKGANQSIALARAGAIVRHIGATNAEDKWLRAEMSNAGVDIGGVQDSGLATGHAIVSVSDDGENQILLYSGANHDIDLPAAIAQLDAAGEGDWALLQNETNGADEFVEAARARGMKLAYSAAPFDAAITARLLPETDLLVVNEVEAAALSDMLGTPAKDAGIPHLVVTRGGDGANYDGIAGSFHVPAFSVTPVDTTGAGDCFFGYLLAAMAADRPMEQAMAEAAAAAAIQVTRPGAAAAIPGRAEMNEYLAANQQTNSSDAPENHH